MCVCVINSENDYRQEKLNKAKGNEVKIDEDKKQLRMSLDEAENQLTKGELMRRALEGEFQRLKMALTDKETENQVNFCCRCIVTTSSASAVLKITNLHGADCEKK